LKKAIKIISACIAIFISICFIGIPSRLHDTNIEDKTLADLKAITLKLTEARKSIKNSPGNDWLPDGYAYINTTEQVDRLLGPYLASKETQKIKELIKNRELLEIDIANENCVRLEVRISNWSSLFSDSYEKMFLIYDKTPGCTCKDVTPDGSKRVGSEKLGNGWYKVRLVTKIHFLWGC